jgi:hypothetical protein
MALSIRFLANTGRPVLYANGRSYVVASGVATVPLPDADAIMRDQAVPLMYIGTTAERPTYDPARVSWPPKVMYDTTLSAPIFLVPNTNPVTWVTIAGAAA